MRSGKRIFLKRQRLFASRERLTVRRVGLAYSFTEDLYHWLLRTPWSLLLLLFFLGFILANLLFAAIYLALGQVQGAQPGAYWQVFFFSVETFSTIGYGNMVPQGIAANVVMTVEAFVGLLVNAFAAGVVIAKFARPSARVLFSNVAVMTRMDGQPVLMMRLADGRRSQVYDAKLGLYLLRRERTAEGHSLRRILDLKLLRDHTPLFALTFTAMHAVDETSPLHGLSAEALRNQEASLILTILGMDEVFMQQVEARYSYSVDDVVWNARFADVLFREPDGTVRVDYTRFHETVPLSQPDEGEPGDA
ncbi:MAG TPA: ion channel [bacterium]|nr:ion channel [bacterium]